jgi:hypothetical protein
MMHNQSMRTTITLDDDIHEYAAIYADANGITISAAINELIKKAQAEPGPEPQIRRGPNGLPLLPRAGRTITCDLVKQLSEDDIG